MTSDIDKLFDKMAIEMAAQARADARVRYAAPELLEALRQMLALAVREYAYLAHKGTEECLVLQNARAAIAKAEGVS